MTAKPSKITSRHLTSTKRRYPWVTQKQTLEPKVSRRANCPFFRDSPKTKSMKTWMKKHNSKQPQMYQIHLRSKNKVSNKSLLQNKYRKKFLGKIKFMRGKITMVFKIRLSSKSRLRRLPAIYRSWILNRPNNRSKPIYPRTIEILPICRFPLWISPAAATPWPELTQSPKAMQCLIQAL